jgi:hypothetical protein
MTPSEDYPRMMFHRTLPWVIVQSRDEEDALGSDWARTVWPAGEDPPAQPALPEFWPLEAPASEPAPDAFEPAARKPRRKPARGRASGPHARTSEAQNANG